MGAEEKPQAKLESFEALSFLYPQGKEMVAQVWRVEGTYERLDGQTTIWDHLPLDPDAA